jgi:hypothetical protein
MDTLLKKGFSNFYFLRFKNTPPLNLPYQGESLQLSPDKGSGEGLKNRAEMII